MTAAIFSVSIRSMAHAFTKEPSVAPCSYKLRPAEAAGYLTRNGGSSHTACLP